MYTESTKYNLHSSKSKSTYPKWKSRDVCLPLSGVCRKAHRNWAKQLGPKLWTRPLWPDRKAPARARSASRPRKKRTNWDHEGGEGRGGVRSRLYFYYLQYITYLQDVDESLEPQAELPSEGSSGMAFIVTPGT